MLHLYLVRHGLKKSTSSDPDLTEEGHQQAQYTAKQLKQFPIKKIIASPFLRTQQTAGHIARELAIEIDTDDRLRERMEFTQYWGTREAFLSEWVAATKNRSYQPPNGDTSAQTGERVKAVIEEVRDEANTDTHVAIVTHGGAIADFLRTVFPEAALEPLLFHFPTGQDYRVDECSITHITKNGDQYELVELHSTTHLR